MKLNTIIKGSASKSRTALPEASLEKLSSELFWQNQEVDLFLSHRLSPKEIEVYQTRVQACIESENLNSGYIGLLTSGTTQPFLTQQQDESQVAQKIILIQKSSVLAAARLVIQQFSLKNETWLYNLPQHHIGGISILARASLMKSKMIEFDGWNAERLVKTAEFDQSKDLLVSLVPTQIFDIVQANLICPAKIKKVFVGGGQMSQTLCRDVLKLGWPVIQTYGMTETSAMIAEFDWALDCFKPFAGIQIKIDNQNRLCVRAPGAFQFQITDSIYVNKQNSFIQTDDLAGPVKAKAPDLYFQLLGRVQNQIKILGELVNLQLIEKNILQSLSMNEQQMAIVAIPDSRKENKLILCINEIAIQKKTTEELGNLKNFLTEKIRDYNGASLGFERIDEFVFVPGFPVTEAGKLQRERLKEIILKSMI